MERQGSFKSVGEIHALSSLWRSMLVLMIVISYMVYLRKKSRYQGMVKDIYLE